MNAFFLALFLLGISTPEELPAATLRIVSPQPGDSVKGRISLRAEAERLPGDSSVEFLINGYSLAAPLDSAPWEMAWNSAWVWDGPVSLQAVARVGNGPVIARSAAVAFRIRNGSTTVEMTTPSPAQPLRGKVRWEARANDPHKVRLMIFYLDGRQVQVDEVGEVSHQGGLELDTTRLSNGPHELCVTATRAQDADVATAMHQLQVEVDNGHLPLAVRPRWREIFLLPGERAELAPSLVFTDGAEQALEEGRSFRSEKPSVATVDEQGKVHAVGVGMTTVTLKAGDFEAATRVTVSARRGFAHLARDGAILHDYDPRRSLWVRTMFMLGAEELLKDPKLAEAAKAAGINALSMGFYGNPADSHVEDLEKWKSAWSPWWTSWEDVARTQGFGIVGIGDTIGRTPEEMKNSLENPWAADAIQLAFEALRKNRITICVEMQDEVGGNPVAPEWRKLMERLNRIPDRVPISWPVAGMQPDGDFAAWLGDPRMSDYSSLYWTYVVGTRQQAHPWGRSLEQTRENLERCIWRRFPILQPDRPRLFLASVAGPFYTKRVQGGEYQPGLDHLQVMGVGPAGVSATILYGAAVGAAGVRVYAYDAVWAEERRNHPLGQRDIQTGAAPVGPGREYWKSMAAAFNLIKALEPHLLRPQMNAPDLGPTITTGARQGPRSRLLMAVNCSESRPTVRVDLEPYRYRGARTVTRYRLVGSRTVTERLPSETSARVVLEPGESIVWLFEPPGSKPD